MGSIEPTVTPMTVFIDRSRSVRGISSPASRLALVARDSRMPVAMGPEDLQEGPDGGDGDGAGTDDPHLAGEGGAHEVREVLGGAVPPQVRIGSSTP